jgi:hypothetical protein
MRHSLRTGREELTALRFAILGGDYCRAAAGNSTLAAMVREQAAQIQRVSPQLEASKPAPQVVNNP